jgi:HAD superfamily hydrolase (TIGR01509 family)
MIKAVVFDMDGVLVSAKDWHYEALNKALGLFGFEITRYEHLVTYDGLPTRTKLQMLTMEKGLPERLHPFINELKQKYTMQIVHLRCNPVFQHEYALARLKSEGYKLGLASNAVRSSVATMMEKANLLQYFDLVLSNEDVSHPKPDPEIYRLAAQTLGLATRECLVVEDNDNGIQACRAAGAKLMAVDSVDDVSYESVINNIGRYQASQ